MNEPRDISYDKTRLRLIIVEDDEALRTVIAKVLSHLGHDVRTACDGAALDAALANYPADVVLLDLNLPGEDGVDIAQRLRRTNNCGIIMITARGMAKDRVSGFYSGADLYFVKPVDPMELHAAILNLGRRLAQSLPTTTIPWHFNPSSSTLRTPPQHQHQADLQRMYRDETALCRFERNSSQQCDIFGVGTP